MSTLLVVFMALAVSMLVIPLMLRLAPRFGLVDRPSARKVHAVPMARVGGWGIVLGTLTPVAIGLPLSDPLVQSYLFGGVVLLAFGTWDDSREVGHYAKFVGQLIAVIPLVTYGGLRVERLPLLGPEALDPVGGGVFTAFALVGMINAINHSDGLDGLAGGESLLSLIALTTLAYLAGALLPVVVGLAALGGTLGFLRYNAHPARLFMGDSGSQFLGFTLGVLAVLLVQRVDPTLSSAAVALLLGLPVIDILTVLAQRAYQGMNWFRATRNHVHHRLLDLGFEHSESVVIIYSVQALFVASGVLMHDAPDLSILGVYLGYAVLLFAVLLTARRRGWHAPSGRRRLAALLASARSHWLLTAAPAWVVAILLPAYLLLGSMTSSLVPRDFGVTSLALLALLVIDLGVGRREFLLARRATTYATAVFVVYLAGHYPAAGITAPELLDGVVFGALGIAIALGARFGASVPFRTTPTDYLVVFVVVVLGLFTRYLPGYEAAGSLAVKCIIVLYGCELLLQRARAPWNGVTLASLGVLGVLAVRGLL